MKKNAGRPLRAVVLTLFFAVLLLGGAYGVYRLAGVLMPGQMPELFPNSSLGGTSSAPQESSEPSSRPEASSSPGVTDSGVFQGNYERAQKKLEKMTLKEKVGQVFVFRCPDTGAVKLIDDFQPGGYCLMGSFFKDRTAEQVKAALESYQRSSKTRMILCCDEEGGTVTRISSKPQLAEIKFGSPQEVFQQGGLQGITDDAVAKAKLLKSLGLNMNLAPVADVSTNPGDFIYERAFGQSANATASFVRLSVEAYNSQNLSCALKHFPGYGNNGDTHKDMIYDKRSYEAFTQSDFIPFRLGIQAGAPCVLVSHNIVECMDAENPASLSPRVHEILRRELGFTGVIMTDDLSMQAIPKFTKGQDPAVAAFLAGNDILLSSDSNSNYNAMYQAVQDGTVSEARLNESVLRILAWKYKMRILL